MRTDVPRILGTVGPAWEPLQNRQAFEPLRVALDDGLARVETGGVRRDGRQVWLLVRFDADAICRLAFDRAKARGREEVVEECFRLVETIKKEPGGGILPFGLFLNDHSGKGHARVQETMIRVVCANTLHASLRSTRRGVSIAVRHGRGVAEHYREATEKMFDDLIGRYRSLASYREALKRTRLPDQEYVDRVLDQVFPMERGAERILRRRRRALERALALREAQRAEVRRLWREGDGHTGDGSAWEAWQGLIQWADHDPRASPQEERLAALTDGSLRRAKERVLESLLDYAGREGPPDVRALAPRVSARSGIGRREDVGAEPGVGTRSAATPALTRPAGGPPP